MLLNKILNRSSCNGFRALYSGSKLKTRSFASVPTIELTQSQTTLDIHIPASPDQSSSTQQHSYPFPWLRDNCQCDACYLPSSQSRLFLLRDLDVDVKPKHVNSSTNGWIQITWSDGHVSTYGLGWLQERQFTADNLVRRRFLYKRPARLWGDEMGGNIPTVTYTDLLENKKSLYSFLVNLEETGIQLITEAPTQTGVIAKIAEQVAFLKRTNYGETFTVKSKWNASNLAYTGATLGLHTDLSFYHYTPGVQLLHCIAQTHSSGGENIFADGFYAATIMKTEYPQLYTVLKETPVDYYDVGVDAYKFHKLTIVPVIQEDSYGNIDKIAYNNQVRDSHLTLPVDQVYLFYKALAVYERLINDSRCCIQHRLANGEIVVFHNYRVLHGRQGYSVTGSGERHLEGGYIDWDELRSKRRVLEEEID